MKRTPLYTFTRTCLAWFFRTLMPIRVRNAENFPKNDRAILCCNHMSMTDPLRLAYSQKRQIYFMAKEELFKNKLVSAVITGLGAFPVSRGKGDKTAIYTAKNILDSGSILGIFPEGTRTRDGNFLRPKSGAVMLAHICHAPIVPCCITPVKGRLPRLFHPCYVSFGAPIPEEELGIRNGTPSEYRNASLLLMNRIAQLREHDLGQSVLEAKS
ncbi:1-acyl-sn-glycerol-3-phosphate acyltransferase [Caproiciproducens sp. NJN-50]|nr:1-acyl-sn-glycerol-3-phosphate acyltransferase [Caproiciproducens sp. NJN-50]